MVKCSYCNSNDKKQFMFDAGEELLFLCEKCYRIAAIKEGYATEKEIYELFKALEQSDRKYEELKKLLMKGGNYYEE